MVQRRMEQTQISKGGPLLSAHPFIKKHRFPLMSETSSTLFHSPHYQQRFSGIARLYGSEALAQLAQAHMLVAGLGGVGSWSAEALARSGVGHITLVDLDDICITNSNRQIHALQGSIGQPKTAIMQDRLLAINPEMRITVVDDFLAKENITQLVTPEHDMIIEATDAATIKAAMIAYCSARKIGIVTVGSAGGKRDPRAVTSDDLARTCSDPMLAKVRQHLYKFYRFARDSNRKFRVDAIYSTEQMVYPKPNGEVCQQKAVLQAGHTSVKLDCTSGFGSSTMVTATFGLIAASRAIERFLMAAAKRSG